MWAFIHNHIHCESVMQIMELFKKTEVFGIDDVTLTLSWANESSYDVSVSPYLPFVFLESASIQLRVCPTIPYTM